MEEQLMEYRKRKQREQLATKTKETLNGLFKNVSWAINRRANNSNIDDTPLVSNVDHYSGSDTDDEQFENKVLSDAEIDQVSCFTTQTLIKYIFIFIIWATVYAIFIQWGFGYVYFLVSLLIAMYLNTRTGKKGKNEVSAYSVFNRNCTSIQGTVKAEDLEKQMIYGRLV